MEFQLPITIPRLPKPLSYEDQILLIGSCFTEHIGNKLQELKFRVLQNPNGILFDPASVASALVSYTHQLAYDEQDIFLLNEVYQSWQHHSRFSAMDTQACLQKLNEAQQAAHAFLKTASCVIVTLGSSFSYRLTGQAAHTRGNNISSPVANCHRAPAQWFTKYLMPIEETNAVLDNCVHQLRHFNPSLQIIFTISPVRHIRDGVVENNRSKARLLEVVHNLTGKFDGLYYFPAYELVIDVLRDYRFYDIDLVHPNYAATEYVMQQFMETAVDGPSRQLMEEVRKIVIARQHRAFQPATQAHRKFLIAHLEKAKQLQAQYPLLDLSAEINYFAMAAAG